MVKTSQHRLKWLKDWRKKNKDKIKIQRRNALLKHRYGITLDDYNKLLEKQNNCCALCKRHKDEFTRSMHVDHDHNTGKIRGILCGHCNSKLGWHENWIKKIENYLRNN